VARRYALPVRAVILAAGRGERMRPFTDAVQKAQIEVGGVSLINRIIDALRDREILDVYIITGYRSEEFQRHLEERVPDGVTLNFIHNGSYESTNNIYSTMLAFQNMPLDEDIILVESDLIFDPRVLDRLLESGYGNAALVDRYASGMDGTVVGVSDGRILSITPPHLQHESFDLSSQWKTLNIYRFTAEFVAGPFLNLLRFYCQSVDRNSYYELVLGLLIYIGHTDIGAVPVGDLPWAEVDDPNDLWEARYLFESDSRHEQLSMAWGGYWNLDVVDFSFIRNEYFPTPSIFVDLKHGLPEVLSNYGSSHERLAEKLSYWTQIDSKYLVPCNGAAEIFPILSLELVDTEILLPSPTFGEYSRLGAGAATYEATIESPYDIPFGRAASPGALVVVSPNNPTGNALPLDQVVSLARQHSDCMVILDCSFEDFSSQGFISNEYLEDAPNLLAIKSLSKCLGVPGLRLGFAACSDPEVVNRLRRRLPVWNMNSLAERFLEVVVKHRSAYGQSIEATLHDRERFRLLLRQHPMVHTVMPSEANFLCVQLNLTEKQTAFMCDNLAANYGLLVKNVSHKMEAEGLGIVRLAVKRPRDQDLLLQAISDIKACLPVS
jgi:histidinol-phosphate/aromatic aminotransferase/cobyric acid decarboxylase-like protein/choline kinase